MRVLFAVNTLSYDSGIPNVAVGVANALTALGERVWIATIRPGAREDLSPGVPVVALWPGERGGFRIFSDGWAKGMARWLSGRALAAIRPDVVVVNYPPLDRCFARVDRSFKLVYFFHNVTAPELYEGAERTRREEEERRILALLASCDAVVANSEFTARKVEATCSVRASVIHPGVDPARYRSGGGGLSPPKQILTVGRIVPHKGVLEMLEAFRLVKQAFPPVRLRVVGKSAGDAYYARVVERAAEIEGVEFLGELPEAGLLREYAASAVFASCSRFEGFGMPFVEAAACGVPSVGFRTAAIPEAVKEGESGFLVEPGDLEALARRILEILRNVELRRSLREGAIRWAQGFSWESRARAHRALYEKLLGA